MAGRQHRVGHRVVRWLGVLAAVAVVATAAVAFATAGADRPRPAVARPPAVLASGGVTLSLPGPAWATGAGVGYADVRGRTRVGVPAAALYRHGSCASDPSLTRAFAGVVVRRGRSARDIAATWSRWVALDVVTGERLRVGAPRLAAGRADVDVALPPGPCAAPRARITVVLCEQRAVVLVRDRGVPDALPGAEAERLLSSITSAGAG